MLFQVTAEGHIRVREEAGSAEGNAQDHTFASEPELQEVASPWPMKRLIEIWNRLPGVEPVSRFTDRNTAIRRLWRALQPQTEQGAKERRRTKTPQRPAFREGSKAAQVCTLLSRPQGATLNEIRKETGWQAHAVRGFMSRALSKPAAKCARSSVRASACIV
jgi:hypothetical protein